MLSKKSMRKKNRTPNTFSVWFLIGFALVMMTAAGCATWDDRDPRPPKLSLPEFSDGGLSKKVALSLFDNRTQLRFGEIEQSFLRPLNDLVKKECPSTLFLTPDDPGFPEGLVDATLVREKGALDNMAIAQTGRLAGFCAVLTGRLESISGFEREKGFWLFKSQQHYERVLIQVNMYASETGAKLLSEAYSREIEISDGEFQALQQGSVENSPTVMGALEELAEDIADDVCELLDETPWIGFVTRVDNDTVTLSSGADAGLTPGIRLELYNSDRIFKTRRGRFFVPGTKTGEIEITAVNPHSARAILLPDSKAGAGYAVRVR